MLLGVTQMGTHIVLDRIINDILTMVNPSTQDWNNRFQVIDELRKVVESVDSLRGATVEPFGSFVSNLFTRGGDLDISIQLANGSYISSAGKKHKQSLLGELLSALRQNGGCRRLQSIIHARVPILKLESKLHGISCDISINNLQGYMKSKFLFWINEIDGRFRDMVLLVKEWAKAHNINNPKCGTFNSYSLSLLVIFHFQTCHPAILPPLKDIYPGNLADDLKGVRAKAEQQIAQTCAVNINRFQSNRSRPVNRSSLAELFISFLVKFSGLSMKASELGICPYTGQWEEIKNNTRWLPKTYPLFVEDPFEQPENTARAVSAKQLTSISDAFETTHRWFQMNKQNQPALRSIFTRSQINRFGANSLASTTSHINGCYATSPAYKAMSPRPQHFLGSRMGRHPSTSNHMTHQRAVQHNDKLTIQRPQQVHADNSVSRQAPRQNQSRPQPMWRPRPDKS